MLDQDHIHSARTRAQRPPRPLRGDRHLLPLGRRLDRHLPRGRRDRRGSARGREDGARRPGQRARRPRHLDDLQARRRVVGRPRRHRLPSLADARAPCQAACIHYTATTATSASAAHPYLGHHGTAHEVRAQRAATLQVTYEPNPDCLRRWRTTAPPLPTAAWIDQPSREALIQDN